MKINNINAQFLLAAGYAPVPPHCDDNKTAREWIRYNGLQRFPRYHIKIYKNGGMDLHYDVAAMHGHEHPGSIISDGSVIEKEILRVKILGMRNKVQDNVDTLQGLIRKYEWLYGKDHSIKI